jgi:hypothetical protein
MGHIASSLQNEEPAEPMHVAGTREEPKMISKWFLNLVLRRRFICLAADSFIRAPTIEQGVEGMNAA